MRKATIGIVLLFLLINSFSLDIRETILNGSFENGLSADSFRPQYWIIGFPDNPPIDSLGEWFLDSAVVGDGNVSLHLVPRCDDTLSYFLSQFIDAPTFDLSGKTVYLSLKMRIESGGNATAFLIAYNPESADSIFGIPASGYSLLYADMSDTGFIEYSDSFVATGPASILSMMLIVNGGTAGAWFDDVSVRFNTAEPGPGPDTSTVDDPLGGATRNFYLGTVSEVARNNSESAFEDLPAEIAEVGDIMNIFAHIKWNGLTGMPLIYGHSAEIELAHRARELGLARMLVFDFTHNSPDEIGEINPLPDGTPVDSLSDSVRAAYIDELLALIDEIDPMIISVGIETNLFYLMHPDQWENLVSLMREVNDALADRSDIHITSYFVLDLMEHIDGTFNSDMLSAWEEIMPYCQSIAFSIYPSLDEISSFPDSYFTNVQEIEHGKPILIPEFGCASDTSFGYSEEIQYQFLCRVISELSTLEPSPIAIIWYQMYDNLYLGVPDYFRNSFSTIGLRDFAGTPKKSYVAFEKMKNDAKITMKPNFRKIPFKIFPNPFNSKCQFVLPKCSDLEIFDINGKKILPRKNIMGSEFTFYDNNLQSGIYFAKIYYGGKFKTKRMLLIK